MPLYLNLHITDFIASSAAAITCHGPHGLLDHVAEES
jgi:hypothetical protein